MTIDDRVHITQSAVGARLRYVRDHHPEGPMTQADLAARSGVSVRTIASIESADGANVQIDKLLRLTFSLGIHREAYLLDEAVFNDVNKELALSVELKRAKDAGVESVLLRKSSGIAPDAAGSILDLLQSIKGAAQRAQDQIRLQGDRSEEGESNQS